MASGNGVHIEAKNNVLDAKEVVQEVNSNVTQPENLNKVDVLDLSKPEETQSSETVTETKSQNSVKATTKASTSKTSKIKNGPSPGTFGRTPRPSLSQSLSFPNKSRTPDSMRASIDAHTKPRVAGPTLSASPSAIRRVSSGLKPIKTALLVKDDDAASSTASPNATPGGGHRYSNSGSGFTSRLEERAERRKQFNSKVEERVQAKEEEKTNMQAKSKEAQDEELKKLRKSLTFKATPMPDFYKEPPPKPQLKKIPTTRPRSPKLGRNKSSLHQVSKSLDQLDILDSPRSARSQTMSPRFTPTYRNNNTAAFKKPNSKSLTKLSELKTVKSKEKVKKTEGKEEGHESLVPNAGSSSPNEDTTHGDSTAVGC